VPTLEAMDNESK
jgi:hypothetical protein